MSKSQTVLTFLLLGVAAAACSGSRSVADRAASSPAAGPELEVVLASEVEWEHLNPARGDKAPKAGTLWGDRNGRGATGFLLRPADGFESPPHIHNVSYRGVVIRGLIHNDDPDAAEMWLPAGSFWTQPRGEVHITAARGTDTLAYIEIEEGPYLVLPPEKEFDSGERPVNVDETNIVWLDASNVVWVNPGGGPASDDAPMVAFLWGEPREGRRNGSLVKLPAGFDGEIRSRGPSFRAVVIRGGPRHRVPGRTDVRVLEPGSYFGSRGESVHHVSSGAEEACVVYVRAEGEFEVVPNP